MTRIKSRVALLSVVTVAIVGCGGGGGSSGSSSDATDLQTASVAFPTSVAVASPTSVTTGSAPAPGLQALAVSASATPDYVTFSDEISAIVNGTATGAAFSPAGFASGSANADCYGPQIMWEDHPDANVPPDPTSGTLPPGDVGIWLSNEVPPPASSDPTPPCSVAQLNSRMDAARSRARAALGALASMVSAIVSDASLSFPASAGDSTDVTSAMSVPPGVTVSSAVVTKSTTSSSEDKYGYTLNMTYDTDGDTNAEPVVLAMAHIPGATGGVFRGVINYRITMNKVGGNCPSAEVTINGSLLYNATSANALTMEMREAAFCGTAVNGLNASGIVDASDAFDGVTNTNGWTDNLNIFRASFDPQTMLGNFAYAWQAGFGDGAGRVFNVAMSDDGNDQTEDLSGVAYFGFGGDLAVASPDPSIAGFICNWAGPQNDHTLLEYAQRQAFAFNTTTGLFELLSGAANDAIGYAPTNSCTYDGLGTFKFDTNAVNGLADEVSNVAVDNNLADGTATSIEAVIGAEITVPAAPTCTECSP